ncbi:MULTISPECIES: AMP-binding protein [Streptomyces]|uniref:AMP-binding protein n=1 Tax=Streptomyces spororaveus TaxID=284039 RepID=A0ABQ3T9W3_9ACTN|nr:MULTISPECIES: AMP-binding protein [Streptomyces]MCM9082422.1 AMP-binding protein [Streptomyces spororaveus]MCX5303003.1 AMP-binding protein [Streptomyces sp. NBC_00160]GHI77164.1 AMP-binding protein [Streptomyces spororaveus]
MDGGPGPQDLAGRVASYAVRWPDRDAVIQVRGEHESRITYGELALRARRLASWLAARGAAGRRVVVAVEDGPTAAVAMLGCLLAGAVAVPVPPPSVSRAAALRTAAIVKDAEGLLALTERAYAAELTQSLSLAGLGAMECRAVDAWLPLPATDADEGRDADAGGALDAARGPARPRAGDPALLQYTSGSTSQPRGVMVTHGNLAVTMAAVQEAIGTDADSRIGGCLPLHHDLGLIGQLLHPLWLGATAVLMPPALLVRDPVRWLEEISRHGITAAAAPDSMYARCAAQVTDDRLAGLDLSRWRTAVDAAEPVSGATLLAFAERFATAGFDPAALAVGYGLAEATLLVAVSAPGEAVRGAGRAPVSCGPVRGAEVRVVDPETFEPLPDGSVGEIWLRGPAVTAGYWNRPVQTAETYGRRTAAGEGGFLRTGDLGMLADGELAVTGRLKDVMLVEGAAVHPHDLERVLLDNGRSFVSAAVFAVSEPSAPDRVVVVQEVRPTVRTTPDHLTDTVRRSLADEFGVTPHEVLLVRPGTVRRTTSGKIRRSAVRTMYLRGELRPLYVSGRAGG